MNTYDYPAGADNENAPWNEVNTEEVEVPIRIHLEMELETSVWTNQYEVDEEGNKIVTSDLMDEINEQINVPVGEKAFANWDIIDYSVEKL